MTKNELTGKITFVGIARPGEHFIDDFDIFTIDADGKDLKQLTFGGEWLLRPSYSPDGTKIAFVEMREVEDTDPFGPEIPDEYYGYIMNSDGTDRKLLIEMNLENGTSFCFSPDSKQLLFATDALYVIDTDGKNLKRIPVEGNPYSAAFTADGHNIIFIHVRETPAPYNHEYKWEPIGFFLIGLDGGNERLLYPFSLLGQHCQEWTVSPDGSKIAFVRNTIVEGSLMGSDIYVADLVFDLNVQGLKNLTEGIINTVGSPTFSPDSSHLAFIEHRNHKTRAFTIRVDGSDLRPLTVGDPPIPTEFSPFAWVR